MDLIATSALTNLKNHIKFLKNTFELMKVF